MTGRGLLAGGVAVGALAALAAGTAGAAAAGALAVAGAAGLGVAALRTHAAAPGAPGLRVLDRQPLAREVGLAVVAAGGDRRLLVGWGPGGVALLAELAPGDGAPSRERAP